MNTLFCAENPAITAINNNNVVIEKATDSEPEAETYTISDADHDGTVAEQSVNSAADEEIKDLEKLKQDHKKQAQPKKNTKNKLIVGIGATACALSVICGLAFAINRALNTNPYAVSFFPDPINTYSWQNTDWNRPLPSDEAKLEYLTFLTPTSMWSDRNKAQYSVERVQESLRWCRYLFNYDDFAKIAENNKNVRTRLRLLAQYINFKYPSIDEKRFSPSHSDLIAWYYTEASYQCIFNQYQNADSRDEIVINDNRPYRHCDSMLIQTIMPDVDAQLTEEEVLTLKSCNGMSIAHFCVKIHNLFFHRCENHEGKTFDLEYVFLACSQGASGCFLIRDCNNKTVKNLLEELPYRYIRRRDLKLQSHYRNTEDTINYAYLNLIMTTDLTDVALKNKSCEMDPLP